MKENHYTFGGYYHDSLLMLILKMFILSIPNIIDLIFTSISYKEECKTYYIIRFITQILTFPYMIISVIYTSYEPLINERSHINCDGIGYLCLFGLGSIIIFSMEITCLVFFIRNIEPLVLLEEIGFYIHYITFPILILYMCRCKKSDYNEIY